ncbi:MAG TPA: zinc dependent phospholipase C family protein [Phycisphaerae bacterium]|nr:zinc dependent phospholipase C family protein [Phycisphaerae bacterium]HNU45464.1 zinc dependent phospholipase C family protein [Phycisphaerae bacterium]
MRITWWAVLAAGLVLLHLPERAEAWGPGFHVSAGSTVLELLPLLPPMVAALLARHREAFLYGNVAADVVFAKRLSPVKQFCHHWATGLRLLDEAGNGRERALAYGYLSHLAADTVAHGKYVPRQVLLSQSTVNLGHFYWELRADRLVQPHAWTGLKVLLAQNHAADHRALARHLSRAMLPYPLNRVLFDRINALAVSPAVCTTLNGWSRLSRRALPVELVRKFREESVDRILSVLSEGQRSPVLREDPAGTGALMQAAVRRRELRRLRRHRLSTEHWLREVGEGFAPASYVPVAMDGVVMDEPALAQLSGSA